MLTRSPSIQKIALAVGFTLACFALGLFIWTQFGGSVPNQPTSYRLTAQFEQAQNLLPNADVRISGVTVGRVLSVKPTTSRSKAVLEIDPKYAPLRSDTAAILRTKTLLGETFVALSPGSPGASPLPDGATLPDSHVKRTQLLDEVLSAFNRPTRTAFRQLLEGNARALRGRSQDLNDSLGNLGPTVDDLDQFLRILDNQGEDLARLVREAGTTFAATDRSPAALRGLMTAGNATLSVTDRLSGQLGATVAALPEFQRNVRRTVGEGAITMREARPLLRVLRRTAPDLGPGLANAESLSGELRRALRSTGPVIRSARKGLPAARRFLASTRPLMDQLYPTGRELVPLVDLVGAYKRELVGALSTHAAAAEDTAPDARGIPRHYVRGLSMLNNELLVAFPKRMGSSRYNAYPAPGSLTDVGGSGRKAPSCAHASNPTPVPVLGSGVPPCRLAPPWEFRGKKRIFPSLERAR